MITLITRDDEVIIPKGNTRLLGWDQVTVLARIVDDEKVRDALLSPFEEEPDAPPPPDTARPLQEESII